MNTNFTFLLEKLEEITKSELCDATTRNMIEDFTRELKTVPQCAENSKFKVTIAIKKKLGRKPHPVTADAPKRKHSYSKDYYEANKVKICQLMQNRYHNMPEAREKQLASRKAKYYLAKESKEPKEPKEPKEVKE